MAKPTIRVFKKSLVVLNLFSIAYFRRKDYIKNLNL